MQFLHLTGMNKKLLLLISFTIILLSPAFGQLKKVYAYKQASLPGIQPRVTTEEGGGNKQRAERKETFNYWFYISFSKKEKITVTGLWISGKRFTVKSEPITELPVKKINYTAASANDTITMVPFTRNAVMLTYPSGMANDTTPVSKYLLNLVNHNELVIVYFWKGKKYYAVKKMISTLAPEAHP